MNDFATPDTSGVLPGFVTGGLVAHVINNLLHDPPPDHQGGELEANGCCPVCCAPCVSLLWLRDNAPTWTSRVAADATGGLGWDWQVEDGGIDWNMITDRWKDADTYGCHDPATNPDFGR